MPKVVDIPVYAKYRVVFKRAHPKHNELDYGDVAALQAGDTVSYAYIQGGTKAFVSGLVEKVNTQAGILRVSGCKQGKRILRPPQTLTFKDVLDVLRPKEVLDDPAVENVGG